MKRRPPGVLPLALFLALTLAGGAAHAGTTPGWWTDLWSTREQQAQSLLQQHHPEEAAQLFSDPRRQAYAQAQAGHDAKAAELLKPFSDATSLYNRGNALARSGKLAEALSAYDAAAKLAPGDPDIRHNRDLVAKALENSHPQQQQQSGGGGQSGQKDPQNNPQNGRENSSPGDNHGNHQGRDQNNNSGSQNHAQNGQQGGDASRQRNGSEDRNTHSGQQAGQQAAQQSGQTGTDKSGADKSGTNQAAANQPGAGQQGGQSPDGTQQRQAQQGTAQDPRHNAAGASSSAANSGQQAEADAAAGVQYQDRAHGRPGESSAAARVPGGRPPPPPSEAALALDQWLQRIPEDSGELLRRKLLIEHRLKQRQLEQAPP